MFQIGDLIVYGNTGVCEVTGTTTIDREGIEPTQPYYVLKPLHQKYVIYTPTNNTRVPMRRIISKGEAERLIDMIPSIRAEAYDIRDSKQLSEHYGAILDSHDCAKLIELTISLYVKKQNAEKHTSRFTATDERFMKQAEELLFGELSAVLGVPRDEMPDFIAAKVDGISEGRSG